MAVLRVFVHAWTRRFSKSFQGFGNFWQGNRNTCADSKPVTILTGSSVRHGMGTVRAGRTG
jgi:hypothetical protein